MRSGMLSLSLLAVLFVTASQTSRAENGSYTYAGGSFTTSSTIGQSITVTGAALSAAGAQLSFSCPIKSYAGGTYQLSWTCTGGKVTIVSSNNSVVFHGTFEAGSMGFSGSGGGRYSVVTYWYSFVGSFSGSMTAGGVTQAAKGSITQSVKTSSQIGSRSVAVTSGSLGWNSAYSPLLAADNAKGRVVAADSITGANLMAFGKPGNGTGEFGTIAGLTQDANGRIYATDSGLDRLVRIDDMTGKNWAQIGSMGTGTNHFKTPEGVRVDAAGRIWVADAGNNRIVRMDDMSGTNWTSFGASGTGAKQFSSPSAIAFDAQGRIYVADAGNNRLVRFDDLTGKNWVSLTEVLSGIYGYFVTAPVGVEVDAAGEIFIATGGTHGYLMKVSNMTGANAVLSSWSTPLSSISRDGSGTIYVASRVSPGLAEMEDAAATGYYASALGGALAQPSVILAKRTVSPPPADAVFTGPPLAFGSRNVGEPGAAQTVAIANLGAHPLTISGVQAISDYRVAKNCPAALAGGASCTLSVQFDPTKTGNRSSSIVLSSNGVHPAISLAVSGTGTAPTAAVLPGSLRFDAQQTGTRAGSQTAILSNSGTGPLTITSIVATGDFTQTNNCGAGLLPGGACTVNVAFTPSATGTRSGALTFADDAVPTLTHQVIALSGVGTATAPALTLSPESLQFPNQAVKTVSGVQNLTLSNKSAAAIGLGAAAYPSGFQGTTTCGASLAKGGSCVFHVAFAPEVSGPVSGIISIPVKGQAAVAVGVSGTGVAAGQKPALAASPSAVNLGPITVGDNPSKVITITNTAGVATAIRAHSLVGGSAFSITHYTCPAILAGKASCTVEVTFLPVSTTPFNNSTALTISEGSGAQVVVSIVAQAISSDGP